MIACVVESMLVAEGDVAVVRDAVRRFDAVRLRTGSVTRTVQQGAAGSV